VVEEDAKGKRQIWRGAGEEIRIKEGTKDNKEEREICLQMVLISCH
jgi:hypothetical protein